MVENHGIRRMPGRGPVEERAQPNSLVSDALEKHLPTLSSAVTVPQPCGGPFEFGLPYGSTGIVTAFR
ncbi:hypothetical protein LUX09_23645 [Streptomyces albogriseolus]|nr:hypothetical protein [Streptomyces albogriseolus]